MEYFEWRREIPQLILIKIILAVGLKADGRSKKIILEGSSNSQGNSQGKLSPM